MASRHNWAYKTIEKGFWIVCTDCGKEDGVYSSEIKAIKRLQALRSLNIILTRQRFGLNRRMRKARNAAK